MELGAGIQGNTGSEGHASGVSAAAAAPNNGSTLSTDASSLNALISMMGSAIGASNADDLANTSLPGEDDVESPQGAANAPITGDGEGDKGSGEDSQRDDQGKEGNFSLDTGSGNASESSSYFSTSHGSSAGATAELASLVIAASEVEANAAQTLEVDSIKNSLEGTNAQLSMSVQGAEEAKTAAVTSADGAITGAVINAGATMMGSAMVSRNKMSPEDNQESLDLEQTQKALEQKSPSTSTNSLPKEPPPKSPSENTDTTPMDSSQTSRESMESRESDMSSSSEDVPFDEDTTPSDVGSTPRNSFDEDTTPSDVGSTPRNSIDSRESMESRQSNVSSSSGDEPLDEDNLDSSRDSTATQTGKPQRDPVADKEELMRTGRIKGANPKQVQEVVDGLNGTERKELGEVLTKKQDNLDAKRTAISNTNNATMQRYEVAGNLGNSLSTNTTQITASTDTEESNIAQDKSKALDSSISSAGSLSGIASAILSQLAAALSNVLSAISNYLVRNQ